MTQSTQSKEDRYDEKPEQEIAKSLEELDAIDGAMLERIGGALSERQKRSIADLLRLDRSLRGPEDVVDQEQYSRRIPKLAKHGHKSPGN